MLCHILKKVTPGKYYVSVHLGLRQALTIVIKLSLLLRLKFCQNSQ